jgi:iron complex outermembrane receptor protein
VLLGITTNLRYKKFNLEISMNGAFGHELYNNTANTVLPISNLGNRNITKDLLDLDPLEATSSPITASSRYLEAGDYMKLSNATLSYNIGGVGTVVKNANVYLTGQNLFVLTGFSGFDPEVNVDKNVAGRPSFGIEYTPYPTARNIILGVNFSF